MYAFDRLNGSKAYHEVWDSSYRTTYVISLKHSVNNYEIYSKIKTSLNACFGENFFFNNSTQYVENWDSEQISTVD